MNVRSFHVAVIIWIFALSRLGLAGSFPDRPTVAELEELVRLGTECVLGINERCYATQYATNPVQYRVAPFANNTEFYLDQSLMGAMASKIRSLVPYYVDPVTVYNGTTNIVMLTVTGLWVQLQIGNYGPHIVTNAGIVSTNFGSDFTATPAIGANAATYGDNPWRIYVAALQERYKALHALSLLNYAVAPKYKYRRGTSLSTQPTWALCRAEAEANYLNSTNATASLSALEAFYAGSGGAPGQRLTIARTITGMVGVVYSSGVISNLQSITVYLLSAKDLIAFGPNAVFDNNGLTGLTTNNTWDAIYSKSGPFSYNDNLIFISNNNLPNACLDPNTLPGSYASRGFYSNIDPLILAKFIFYYCTVP